MKFDGFYRVIRAVKDISNQIFAGSKQFLNDRKRYRELIKRNHQSGLGKDALGKSTPNIALDDLLFRIRYQQSRRKFLVVTFPFIGLFCIPVVGYLALPAFLYMPERVLTGPLLTKSQTKTQQLIAHNHRKAHFKKALSEMREAMVRECEEVQHLCQEQHMVDPTVTIEKAIPLFTQDSAAISLSKLHRHNLIELAHSFGSRYAYVFPSVLLRSILNKKATDLMSLVEALSKEDKLDLPSTKISALHAEVLFELLYGGCADNEKVEVALTRLRRFASILRRRQLNRIDNLSQDLERSILLHGLIYLASRKP